MTGCGRWGPGHRLTSLSLAVLTAVVGGATGLLVLTIAATGLAAAAVLVRRTSRGATSSAPARARIGRTVFPAAVAPGYEEDPWLDEGPDEVPAEENDERENG